MIIINKRKDAKSHRQKAGKEKWSGFNKAFEVLCMSNGIGTYKYVWFECGGLTEISDQKGPAQFNNICSNSFECIEQIEQKNLQSSRA